MKHMKKLLSLVLTLVTVFALSATAMAANQIVDNQTSHTYDAYQIFKGTQAVNDPTLGDLDWGNGIDPVDFLAALKVDDDTKAVFNKETITTAADVAKALVENTSVAEAFADVAYAYTTTKTLTLAADEAVELAAGYYLLVDASTLGDGDAKNAALLQVTNKDKIEIKEKATAPSIEKTVNDPDVNIGDTVTFTLTATMPSKLEGYDTYKVVFHDTMSKGLTFGSITDVTIGGTSKKENFTLSPAVPSADEENDGKTTFTLTCNDVLALGATVNTEIVVTYTATVDSDAIIGSEGNPNEVYLEYSNNPNADGTGNTPKKEVKVYTWEIPVFKYTKGENDAKNPLPGAGFTLYKDAAFQNPVKLVDAGNGIYKVCTLTSGCTHTHIDENEIITDGSGKFEIEGLEKGTYYLKETTTPAGYNTLASAITVTIGESGAIAVSGSNSALANNQVEIENNSGIILPETGGIGTTIFYVLGGVMMAGAVVLMVTKRRMNAER